MFLACVLASSRVSSTTQGFANRDSSAGMDSNRNLALCTDSSLVPQGAAGFSRAGAGSFPLSGLHAVVEPRGAQASRAHSSCPSGTQTLFMNE